jgi:hypothetical protein
MFVRAVAQEAAVAILAIIPLKHVRAGLDADRADSLRAGVIGDEVGVRTGGDATSAAEVAEVRGMRFGNRGRPGGAKEK